MAWNPEFKTVLPPLHGATDRRFENALIFLWGKWFLNAVTVYIIGIVPDTKTEIEQNNVKVCSKIQIDM